jgi:hypothetical protein
VGRNKYKDPMIETNTIFSEMSSNKRFNVSYNIQKEIIRRRVNTKLYGCMERITGRFLAKNPIMEFK